MSIKTVSAVIERFLTQHDCNVLALKGAWGVGKTYAWRQLVEKAAGSIWPRTYAYVSLFGIASMSDLRMAILANSASAGKIDGQEVSFARWRDHVASRAAWFRRWIGSGEGFGAVKGVSIAFDALVPSLVRDMLICFDDFERLNTSKVSHEELMGLISDLKERAGCKIAIILNDAKLPEENDAFTRYREKVVDIELRFSTTAEEAADWGLAQTLPHRDTAKAYAHILDITNVRVLRKIATAIKLLAPIVEGLRAEVARITVQSVVLITWCIFDNSGEAPTLSFVRSFNNPSERKGATKPEDGKSVRWGALLKEYQFALYDELDAAVTKVIEQGYVEESGFPEEAKKRDQLCRSEDLHGKLAAAWALFHDTFDDNERELVSNLQQSALAVSAQLPPGALNAIVVLFRELGHGKLADNLIEHYVEIHKNDSAVFDLEKNSYGGTVTDVVLKDKFKQRIVASSKSVSLREAVERMARTRSWTPEHQSVVASASTDDLLKLLKGDLSVSRDSAIRILLALNQPPVEHVAQRTLEALTRIGRESKLNAARIRRYGIIVPGNTDGGDDGGPPAQ
jgi:hypothetical protein